MHDTYDKNQARFFRDYAGKVFQANLPLHDVSRNIMNEEIYNVSLGGGFLGDVACSIEDKRTLEMITDQNKGDILSVEGTVKDHTLGVVQLDSCKIQKP